MRRIDTVTIVGANGTMGKNMAAIFAAFGNARVYLISREKGESEKAVEEACDSVRSGSIRGNLVPMDYSGLEDCVTTSDLVLESVSEAWEIKKSVTERIAAAVSQVKHREILCGTSSSGLPVTKLAEVFPEGLRKNYYGLHMFNPPYTMTLCELVLTKYSVRNLTKELSSYLSLKLYRTVVEVKDTPAYLGNRIGFQFINQALLCAGQYQPQGGIDYMDAVLGPFTGRMMAPLMTADFVGLDVHKAVVDNVYQNTEDFRHSSFRMAEYANTLVFEGKYGRKTGGGLFCAVQNDNGSKTWQVYDIARGCYRDVYHYTFPFAVKMTRFLRTGDYQGAYEVLLKDDSLEAGICVDFLLNYILYSIEISGQAGAAVHAADSAMAAGFHWCPPLGLIEVMGGKERLVSICRERLSKDLLNQIDLERMARNIEPSHYDYRRYLRARL